MALPFFNLRARRGGRSMPRSDRFNLGERSGTHCIGGWMGSLGGSARALKMSPPPGFDARSVQPIASRCTD